ncbi:MAG: sigma-54 dependent transcriptional regulator [bacterium]|nr:sigma-54 dependent transcriptional regulator [bacterium]
MNKTKNILLVDDDEDALLSLVRALKATIPDLSFNAATKAEMALQLIKEKSPQVLVTDLCLNELEGPESGFNLLKEALKIDSTMRAIILTGVDSPKAGIKCLELGASSFIEKPADISHLSALIKDGVSQAILKRDFAELNQKLQQPSLSNIIGSSDLAKKLRAEIQYAASNNQSILITGETGTGKGLCALAIHKLSKRSAQKFVRYQPSYATFDLVNSDLFGHVKGAFTGAEASRHGLISESRAGTLFLDEIDELPNENQVLLLGVLQEKIYRSVGSNQELEADFRLISATNNDLSKTIESKKLRLDFYHRIAHAQIHVPALRERIHDIKELSEHFLTNLRESESVSVFELEDTAISKLHDYKWPGNIRELQAVIEGAAYRAQFEGRNFIAYRDLEIGNLSKNSQTLQNFHSQVEDFKSNLIKHALARNQGNQLKASQELGMDRTSLRRIIERNEG